MNEPNLIIISGEDNPIMIGDNNIANVISNITSKDRTSSKDVANIGTTGQEIENMIRGEDVMTDQQAAADMHQLISTLLTVDNLLAAASSGGRPALSTALPGLWIPMEEDQLDDDDSEETNLLPKYKMINTFRHDESCCESLVKYILVIFNIVFAIAGLAFLSLGTYIKIHEEYYMDFMGIGESFNIPIIVGMVIFVVAVLGCFGACMKKPIMLYIYAVLHFAIIIAEISIILFMVIIKSSMQFYFHSSHSPGIVTTTMTWTWDFMQRMAGCCGWEGPGDWTNSTLGHIPSSCCVNRQVVNCGDTGDDSKEDIFSEGCLEVLQEQYGESLTDLTFGKMSIILTGIAVLQLIIILCSCCNASTKIRRQEKYM